MSEIALSLINILAPTIAKELIPKLQGRKLNRDDLLLVIFSITAEENRKIQNAVNNNHNEMHDMMGKLDDTDKKIVGCIEKMQDVLVHVSEDTTIIKKRTERI